MLFVFLIFIIFLVLVISIIDDLIYSKLESEVLNELNISAWDNASFCDEQIIVKSRSAIENYDATKFFKDNREKIDEAFNTVVKKEDLSKKLTSFLENNKYKHRLKYGRIKKQIKKTIENCESYRINVNYITYAGNNLANKVISLGKEDIREYVYDPSLTMRKGEYGKYMKEKQRVSLEKKQREYYDKINSVVNFVNNNIDSLILKDSRNEIDKLVIQVFDRTVNSIKKIKTIDSEEWDLIETFISQKKNGIEQIVEMNYKINEYYESENFLKIKETCELLMNSQKEFNEYINEKIKTVSTLFGCRTVRTETINEDINNYVRPYKKIINPFIAEVSSSVFANAENNPLEYVVKYFYPNRNMYPEQIKKLCLLVEELETLRDAKKIIDNYKLNYQKYLLDVPKYVLENDEIGLYSRLGFANIDESILAVEYKFSYTSGGGMAQRTFAVPMTEETITDLINTLENKLTTKELAKEQRNLMTRKLREAIKSRDHYTCCNCGNSVEIEPNLLLEIDHIVPVSKGGLTIESNLQTLCWKCNRTKSDKILS